MIFLALVVLLPRILLYPLEFQLNNSGILNYLVLVKYVDILYNNIGKFLLNFYFVRESKYLVNPIQNHFLIKNFHLYYLV